MRKLLFALLLCGSAMAETVAERLDDGIPASSASITPTKGRLWIGSGTDFKTLSSTGTNGWILTLDNTQTLGAIWAAAPGVDTTANITWTGTHTFNLSQIWKEQATPANPAATYHRIYFKADGLLYALNSAGTESLLSPTGTVSSVATGTGLQGGTITTTGTIDLRLDVSGTLSKTLGAGSNELGVAALGIGAAQLAANAATNAKLDNMAALTVKANATNASATPTDVAAGSDYQVFRRNGTALAFGAISLDQSAAVSGTLPSGNGGTASAFTAFTGPTTATKTFTLPDASASILTTNAAVTAGQGGTGSSSVPAAGNIPVGNAGGTTYAPVALSGDATLASTGAMTIANDAVTTVKILNANVTAAKMVNAGVFTGDATTTFPALTIGNDAITTVKILNANVTAAKMVNAGIFTGDVTTTFPAVTIGNDAITTAKILNSNVTDGKLASSYIYADGTRAFTGDQSMGTHKLTSVTDPTAAQDAATKNYVDSIATGIEAREVRLATAGALSPANAYLNGASGVGATLIATSFGALSVDGSAVAVSDRILVKNEATLANNGIYSVTATGGGAAFYTLTRAADQNTTGEFSGTFVAVPNGTANANTLWICTAVSPVTVGTTDITWSQFAPNAAGTAGGDLTGTYPNPTIGAAKVTAAKMVNSGVFTGDATSTFPALTIGANAITLGKMATIAQDRLIGGATGAGTATPTALTVLPTGCMPALTGDVTNSAGALATTIANDAVTTVKILNANVTAAKMVNAGVFTGDCTTTFPAITIGNLAITNAKIAASTIDLTAKVTGILPTANGGTGIAYFTAAGPSTARVYTFPDAASTVLTTNAAVTVAQGGTGLATLTAHAIQLGNGTSTPTQLGLGTTTTLLHGASAGDPTWGGVVNADITNSTIDLTAKVTGALPIVNGGTAATDAATARTNLGLAIGTNVEAYDAGSAVRAYNSGSIAITTATTTALTFDSEIFDTDTMHSTTTNTGRLTAKTAGMYQISACASFDQNSTGARFVGVKLNGTTIIAVNLVPASNSDQNHMAVSTLYQLALNDYVECVVYQSSGGNLNIVSASHYTPEFMMIRIK